MLSFLLLVTLAAAPPIPRRYDPGPVEDRLVYTVAEAAALLGVSRWTYYDAASRGEVPITHLGKRRVVSKAQLEQYLAGQWAKPA